MEKNLVTLKPRAITKQNQKPLPNMESKSLSYTQKSKPSVNERIIRHDNLLSAYNHAYDKVVHCPAAELSKAEEELNRCRSAYYRFLDNI